MEDIQISKGLVFLLGQGLKERMLVPHTLSHCHSIFISKLKWDPYMSRVADEIILLQMGPTSSRNFRFIPLRWSFFSLLVVLLLQKLKISAIEEKIEQPLNLSFSNLSEMHSKFHG